MDTNEMLMDLSRKLAQSEEDRRNLHYRLNEMGDKVDHIETLAESVHTMANEMVHMREDMAKIDSRLLNVEARPGKRWDLIVTTILTALASGVIGFVVSQIFK